MVNMDTSVSDRNLKSINKPYKGAMYKGRPQDRKGVGGIIWSHYRTKTIIH